jgi:hypothetical protein
MRLTTPEHHGKLFVMNNNWMPEKISLVFANQYLTTLRAYFIIVAG